VDELDGSPSWLFEAHITDDDNDDEAVGSFFFLS
jgi:hypothetical protein